MRTAIRIIILLLLYNTNISYGIYPKSYSDYILTEIPIPSLIKGDVSFPIGPILKYENIAFISECANYIHLADQGLGGLPRVFNRPNIPISSINNYRILLKPDISSFVIRCNNPAGGFTELESINLNFEANSSSDAIQRYLLRDLYDGSLKNEYIYLYPTNNIGFSGGHYYRVLKKNLYDDVLNNIRKAKTLNFLIEDSLLSNLIDKNTFNSLTLSTNRVVDTSIQSQTGYNPIYVQQEETEEGEDPKMTVEWEEIRTSPTISNNEIMDLGLSFKSFAMYGRINKSYECTFADEEFFVSPLAETSISAQIYKQIPSYAFTPVALGAYTYLNATSGKNDGISITPIICCILISVTKNANYSYNDGSIERVNETKYYATSINYNIYIDEIRYGEKYGMYIDISGYINSILSGYAKSAFDSIFKCNSPSRPSETEPYRTSNSTTATVSVNIDRVLFLFKPEYPFSLD